ncbi:phage antirepressor [Nocardia tengchongensis]
MSTDLMPFTYEGAELRSFVIDGEPWFVAADVARLLEYSATSAMTRRIDDDDKGVRNLHTLGGIQQMAIISEAGFYAAILGSQSDGARLVKRWLTHEVLPALRRTGSYSVTPTVSDDELIHRALEVSARRVAELTEKTAELAAKVEADAPKVEAFDQFMEADGTYLVGTVARMLGTSQNKLFAELRERGVLISKGAGRNTPYQRYMEHFVVKATSYTHSDGSEGTSYTTRVRPSGVDFIRRRLAVKVVAS